MVILVAPLTQPVSLYIQATVYKIIYVFLKIKRGFKISTETHSDIRLKIEEPLLSCLTCLSFSLLIFLTGCLFVGLPVCLHVIEVFVTLDT